MLRDADQGWLLLIHQLPPRPAYLRVKIWRRLQRLGAVPLKNTVYVLPRSDAALESFQWVLREITAGGGEGSVCEARFIDGASDADVTALFDAARDADYQALAEQVRGLAAGLPRRRQPRPEERAAAAAELGRIERRLAEVAAIDFFAAPAREAVDGLIADLAARVRPTAAAPAVSSAPVRGATWVTRTGIHVDRIASAWLIRRFIDPEASFKFVPAKGYRPVPGELRFDMFEAEYTHEGDRCTFEVLVQRFGLADAALVEIAEIIHDLDLDDGKFDRGDAEGVGRLLAGICLADRDDLARLERGSELFEDLYRYFARKRRDA